MRITPLLVPAVLLGSACVAPGGDAPLDEVAGESVDEAALHGPPRILGRDIDRHHLANGAIVPRAIDLSATPIEAYVECDGAFTQYPGTGAADGTFVVPGVPRHARYWLRVGTSWYESDEPEVDLGLDQVGRPDAQLAAPGTSLAFDVTGLAPVGAADDFQLTSANAGVGFYSTASFFNPIIANAPALGDTALTGAVFPFDADPAAGTSQFPLIEAARGDRLTLTQLVARQDGATPYVALDRALSTTVDMTQGASTLVSGTLAPAPGFATTVDFRQAAFEGLAAEIAPGAVPLGTTLFVSANQLPDLLVAGTPDLAYSSFAPLSGDRTVALRYGNPFPASWPRFLASPTTYQVPYDAPAAGGTITKRQLLVSAFAQQFVRRAAERLGPVVSAPRAIRIDGELRADGVRDTTTAPVLTWRRPELGDPAAYSITVIRLRPTAPIRALAATLNVDGDTRRVRIPPGVLQSGELYLFAVQAIATSEHRPRSQLVPQMRPPSGRAVAVSQTIRAL